MKGLNPCFNGRYSRRIETLEKGDVFMGLNPCFNGRYSRSNKSAVEVNEKCEVLILVLMEDTLGDR